MRDSVNVSHVDGAMANMCLGWHSPQLEVLPTGSYFLVHREKSTLLERLHHKINARKIGLEESFLSEQKSDEYINSLKGMVKQLVELAVSMQAEVNSKNVIITLF